MYILECTHQMSVYSFNKVTPERLHTCSDDYVIITIGSSLLNLPPHPRAGGILSKHPSGTKPISFDTEFLNVVHRLIL